MLILAGTRGTEVKNGTIALPFLLFTAAAVAKYIGI